LSTKLLATEINPSYKSNVEAVCSICFKNILVKEIVESMQVLDFKVHIKISVEPHECDEKSS